MFGTFMMRCLDSVVLEVLVM